MRKYMFLLWMIYTSVLLSAQTHTQFIVVDQFGYLPDAPKVAVIRNPITGFDAQESYSPGSHFALVDAKNNSHVFTGTPVVWNNGSTDPSSGDQVWWFDFSEVSETGRYYVLDIDNNKRSFEFRISPSVYNEVLKHAVRTFFYQRVGFAKEQPYAEKGWTDGASHLGPLQDTQARLYNTPGNPATQRDVSGGWYDAGDYNKYTNWTADYVIGMMYAYIENPHVWTDDFNIPESGNGIPDLLDEAKWGLEHLLRLQNSDGGVISVVGLSHASPPSAAKGQSLYGPPSTSATLTAAGAYAFASVVYKTIGMNDFAQDLKDAAIKAWDWADANPNVLFRNNDPNPPYNSQGLASGQQEVNNYGRLTKKIQAACFLFAATGEVKYRQFFDDNYLNVNMMQWWFAFPFQTENQDMLLFYSTIEGATLSVAQEIKLRYNNSMMNSEDNFPAIINRKDPYRAHIKDYTWGSNSTKSKQGNMFMNVSRFNTGTLGTKDARDAAVGYVNYLHGVNPLNFVFLSNMFKYGAKNGVREFYHTWFADGSAKWDRVGTSTYGPAPGFLTGGPNPLYNWDSCCPGGCWSAANNAKCISENIIPPKSQPAQKSYKDFNSNWPLNSWEVTENANGYQINYIRLLANFVNPQYDCNGDLDGEALIDACGQCAGGNTGVVPVTNSDNCVSVSIPQQVYSHPTISVYPNPVKDRLYIVCGLESNGLCKDLLFTLVDSNGNVVLLSKSEESNLLNLSNLSDGVYFLLIENKDYTFTHKIIKEN